MNYRLFLMLLMVGTINPHSVIAGGPPNVPTCASGQLPVMSGSFPNQLWICEPDTDPAALQEQEMINMAGNYYSDFANHCPAGTTYVVYPYQNGGVFTVEANCVTGSPTAYNTLAWLSSGNQSNPYGGPTGYAQQYQYTILQPDIVQASQLWTTLTVHSPIDTFFCAVSGWFTGNLGKGIAVIGALVLGVNALLAKLSPQAAAYVLIGIAVIFSAKLIADRLGAQGLYCDASAIPQVSSQTPQLR